jgi:nicotinamidase-related amidase
VPDAYTEPRFESAALITIDTQCDVLDGGKFPIPGTTQVLPAMRRLLEAFRVARREIVHVVRIYEPGGSNAERCRRALLESGKGALALGTEGCQLAPELHPGARLDEQLLLAGGIQPLGEREVLMYKPRWGAFYDTPLEGHLREREISTLVFTGCNFPNCPRTSIYEASERDFRIVLATDAISGLYERGERELEGIGVALMRTDEVIGAIARAVVTA